METTIKNTKLYFKDTTGYEYNHDIHGIKKKKSLETAMTQAQELSVNRDGYTPHKRYNHFYRTFF